jgi:hypothetical protein
MLSDAQQDYLTKAVRVMQIIVAAMAMGIVFFFVVALFTAADGKAEVEEPILKLISYIALAVGVGAAALSMTVPVLLATSLRRSALEGRLPIPRPSAENVADLGDVPLLAGVYQTQTIIRAAILEGGAFLNLVAYIMEHQQLSLVAAGALLLLLIVQIPTVARVSDWVEAETKWSDELRQFP